MALHHTHESHTHQHGPGCGHRAIQHEGHQDYVHDGHLHHLHDGHVDEHVLAVSSTNPSDCTPNHACRGHETGHRHGANCGHDAIPHGDHVDYLVDGHLHFEHSAHCDHHGAVQLV